MTTYDKALAAAAAYVSEVLGNPSPDADELERAERLTVLVRHAYGHCYEAQSRERIDEINQAHALRRRE